MDIFRLVNALRNKIGVQINKFLPPHEEIFQGHAEFLDSLFFVGQRWDYGSRLNGDGFEYRRFIPAFKELSENVYFIPIEAKEKILPAIKNSNCDRRERTIVFSVFQNLHQIPQEYFKLSDEGFFLVNWYTDDDMHFDIFSKYVASHFDLNITTFEPNYDRYKSIGANVFISQWGGIGGLPFLDNRCYLACFIGRMYGQRTEIMKRLKKEFGDLVFVHDTRIKPISEEMMFFAYQNSWLAIDEPTSYDGKTLQIKARVFENPSMGCLLLTKPNQRLMKYFDVDKEILFYDSIDNLIDIVKDCRRNPEPYKKMSRLAYERVNKEHLYRHRFSDIFKFLQHNGVIKQ